MMVSDKIQRIRDKKLRAIAEEEEKKISARGDSKKPNVMISERRVKAAAKFVIADVPHPFTSREEYERSLQMPLGGASLLSSNAIIIISLNECM